MSSCGVEALHDQSGRFTTELTWNRRNCPMYLSSCMKESSSSTSTSTSTSTSLPVPSSSLNHHHHHHYRHHHDDHEILSTAWKVASCSSWERQCHGSFLEFPVQHRVWAFGTAFLVFLFGRLRPQRQPRASTLSILQSLYAGTVFLSLHTRHRRDVQ